MNILSNTFTLRPYVQHCAKVQERAEEHIYDLFISPGKYVKSVFFLISLSHILILHRVFGIPCEKKKKRNMARKTGHCVRTGLNVVGAIYIDIQL